MFLDLPVELRRMIWRFCIPEGRVFEFDFPARGMHETTCSILRTSIMNAKPPAFVRACREARDVASKNGGFLSDIYDQWKVEKFGELQEFEDFPYNPIRDPWFFFWKDTVHLNWESSYSPFFEMEYNPVPALICLARIGQGGSIVADLLLSFKREYTFNLLGHPHRLLYQHWLHILPPLEYLNGFNVCLSLISVHTSDTLVIDSGLFGSLATPIQLVDTSDRATIRRMYELWQTTFHDDVKLKDPEPEEIFKEMVLTPNEFESRVCLWHEEFEQRWLWSKWIGKFHENTLHTIDLPENVFTGPKFDRDGNAVTGLDPMRIKMPMHSFNKAHPWVRATIESMPRFRSVIMFRYCKAKCYSLDLPKFKRPEFMPVLHDEQITAIT